jgi:hypothetical protein
MYTHCVPKVRNKLEKTVKYSFLRKSLILTKPIEKKFN